MQSKNCVIKNMSCVLTKLYYYVLSLLYIHKVMFYYYKTSGENLIEI